MAWDSGTGLPSPYVAAIEEIIFYFDGMTGVDALLLTGSWARGKGNVLLGANHNLPLLHNEVKPVPSTCLRENREKWLLHVLFDYFGQLGSRVMALLRRYICRKRFKRCLCGALCFTL